MISVVFRAVCWYIYIVKGTVQQKIKNEKQRQKSASQIASIPVQFKAFDELQP